MVSPFLADATVTDCCGAVMPLVVSRLRWQLYCISVGRSASLPEGVEQVLICQACRAFFGPVA